MTVARVLRTQARVLILLSTRQVSMKTLLNRLAPERIVFLTADDKTHALNQIVDALCTSPAVTDCEALRKAIFDREKILSTGIGLGVALPHAKIASVADFVIALGILIEPIDYGALDDRPVQIIVMIAGPMQRQSDYLKILAQITLGLKNRGLRESLIAAKTVQDVLDILGRE
jgi:mannitol/fructose-specific phosphotransferase system IIA component (Ntr-type)